MKKIVLNVVSVFILSICASSCSKDKDDIVPVTKKDLVGQWIISEAPVISVTFTAGDAVYQQKANEKLSYLFHKDDKYLFNDDLSCIITRGNSIAPYPETFNVEGGYVILDGYIKLATNLSGNKLTLKASNNEIREIIKVELKKPEYGFDADIIDTILKFVTGNVQLVLTKE
jgi:hypothetical protein